MKSCSDYFDCPFVPLPPTQALLQAMGQAIVTYRFCAARSAVEAVLKYLSDQNILRALGV